jgi:hypothetical protein
MSLQRSIKSPDAMEVVTELAEYFSNLIFNLVDKPLDEEINLESIREVKYFKIYIFYYF